MELGALIEGLGVRCVRGVVAGVRVCDVTEDSRTAVPGSLFVARRGLKADGRLYAEAALECGAVAVLTDDASLEVPARSLACLLVCEGVARVSARVAERFYGGPSSKLAVVAITGTNGKTTTAHLVHQILNRAHVRCGLIGTVEVDDGREVAPATMTTPPAIEVSRTLATMVEAGCAACVMEASSHALDQGRVSALAIDVGVFTNLTGDHQDYHGSMGAYRAAKKRLFEQLGGDGVSVVNMDDPEGAWMAGPNPVRCTGGEGGDWRVRVVGSTIAGLELAIEGPAYAVSGRTRLVGGHNAMNALEAIAAADAVLERRGLGAEERRAAVAAALPVLHAPRGRLERVVDGDGGVGPFVFVDFAHSDDALGKALGSARALVPAGGRLWVVFGCGGVKDELKRPRMGRLAGELADRVVVTSDNPRTEPPGRIIGQILEGMGAAARERALVHADRARAIRAAVEAAGERDVIVIAGKGHEREQELAGADGGIVRIAFDDAKEARAALRERRLRASAKAVGA